jgi:hypothetical protein
VDPDPGALLRGAKGDGAPEPGSGAGDENRLALESLVDGGLLSHLTFSDPTLTAGFFAIATKPLDSLATIVDQ